MDETTRAAWKGKKKHLSPETIEKRKSIKKYLDLDAFQLLLFSLL